MCNTKIQLYCHTLAMCKSYTVYMSHKLSPFSQTYLMFGVTKLCSQTAKKFISDNHSPLTPWWWLQHHWWQKASPGDWWPSCSVPVVHTLSSKSCWTPCTRWCYGKLLPPGQNNAAIPNKAAPGQVRFIINNALTFFFMIILKRF